MELTPHQKQFIWSPKDLDKPYRVCATEFTLGVQRFETAEQAKAFMEEMRDRGHQAIMSFINIQTSKWEFKGYVKGRKYKKKKE